MNHNNNYMHTPQNELALQELKKNWNWYLIFGAALVALGTAALFFAVTSTLISVVYIGALLVIAGLFEIAKSLKVSKWSTFFLHLFVGILYVIGGGFIILCPFVNALTLTLLLAIFFVCSGILKIIFSFAKNLPHRGWLLLSGIITLLLGILIWKQWPYSGLWVLGTFLGIELIFTGWTWIMLALMAKNMKK